MRSLITLLRFVLGYSSLLSVGAGILIWQALMKTPLSAEIKWSLYGGAFVATSYSNWKRERWRAEDAEAALSLPKAQASRVFAEEPQALLERYGHTGILADKLLVPYLDKWITVSGRFEGIAESLLPEAQRDAIHLSLKLECGRRIHLRFPIESRDRLQLLREGRQLAAVCQVKSGIGLGVFALENSELIRVEPLRPALARVS